MTVNSLHSKTLETPIGPMLAMAESRGLCLLEFADREGLDQSVDRLVGKYKYRRESGRNAVLTQLATELDEYFAQQRHAFSIAVWLNGTSFQCQVWHALRQIPYGATRAYGEFAAALGKPNASRAVGRANGLNPVAVVVPCHRLIGANGDLTGYGGGKDRKAALLDLENATREHSG